MEIYTKKDFPKLSSYINNGGFIVEKHFSEDLFIYGYSVLENNFRIWDNFSVNLRGLIVNSVGEVISRGIPKFFTFKSTLSERKILLNENQLFNIPVGPFEIHEKIDGTLGILYWINDKPFIASQRSFRGKKVEKANSIFYSKYQSLFNLLKRDRTYLFEFIYPETRVVVNYGDIEDMYLIAVIENSTGESLNLEDENVGFPLPANYTEDFKQVTNFKDLQNLNLRNKEGFVIKFADGQRIKIIFPWYRETHNLIDQLKYLHKSIHSLNSRLKKHLNLPSKPLSFKHICEKIQSGESLSAIEKNIPDAFYYYGVEEWIESKLCKFDNHEFEDDCKFEVGLNNDVSNDVSMWGFIERLSSKYN